MQFSRDLRPFVIAGDVSVSFRLWSRPKVRVGGRNPVGPAFIEVDSVERETGLESLRRRAAHAGPVTGDTLVYRIGSRLA